MPVVNIEPQSLKDKRQELKDAKDAAQIARTAYNEADAPYRKWKGTPKRKRVMLH